MGKFEMKSSFLLIFLFHYSLAFSQSEIPPDTVFYFSDTLLIEKYIDERVVSYSDTRINSAGFVGHPSSINGINLGSAEWVDYNSDGLLDIFINGFKIGDGEINHGTIFQNHGQGVFKKADITVFTRTIYGDQDWGDYNNDGNIDLIITGTTSGHNSESITEIYKNMGNNSFIPISHDLPRICRSDIHWEDMDGDGDLDIFLMGLDQNEDFIARIYVNSGNDSFSQGPDILTGGSGRINFTSNTSIWADLDNDGDIDGVLGYSSKTGGYGIKLCENLGSLKFSVKNANLPQLNYSAIDVFDFNNDNLMDLVLSGNKEQAVSSYTSPAYLVIMENTGDLKFSEKYSQTTGAYWGSIDCGDFNNDGYSDILINGIGNNTRSTHILVNSPELVFTKQEFGLSHSTHGDALWGRIIPETSIDIFIHGTTTFSSGDATSKLFLNESDLNNIPPSVPTDISCAIMDGELTIQWNSSIDDYTGLNGISYNVRLGTSKTNFDIIQGLSTDVGSRKVMEIGNNGLNKTFKIDDLAKGKYYFEVQAIDNAFNASPYSQGIEICNGINLGLPDTVYKCVDDEYLISIAETFTSINWDTGQNTNVISIQSEGIYKVQATDPYGCISTDSILVLDETIPKINIGKDSFLCEPPSLVLDATFPGSEYRWMDNSTSPTFEVTDFGIYWVEVKNNCGISRDTIRFETEREISFIPNVFTPNNDGKNDYFEIESENEDLQLLVFNRSGKLIYESGNYKNNWYGENQVVGTYYYIISDVCEKSYRGIISILR